MGIYMKILSQMTRRNVRESRYMNSGVASSVLRKKNGISCIKMKGILRKLEIRRVECIKGNHFWHLY